MPHIQKVRIKISEEEWYPVLRIKESTDAKATEIDRSLYIRYQNAFQQFQDVEKILFKATKK